MALTEAQKRNAEKNRRYWAEREAEALKHYITEEKEYDKEIKRIYQNMLDACQKEIESFYAKYAATEGISLAEAKKRVSKLDIAAYERKAAKYVKEKDFSKKANEEMRLYNATMKINRLEMLKANIGLETIAGHEELEKFMAGILKDRTMDELTRQAGILGKTVRNNAAKAHAIVNGSFHNGTFSDRIWQYQDLMREDLGKLLQQGLIQGKGARALTKDLRKYLIGDKQGKGATYNVERLMRTELARVQTEAQKQSYIENGVEFFVFRVNGGCCAICQGLSGKRFRVDKMMPGENAAPLHPHCRCSTSAYVDRAELDAILDFVDQGGTYEEWNLLQRQNKMASDAATKNDWSKTVSKNISKKEKQELIRYASERGIKIPELRQFDGDVELLRSEIDALAKIAAEYKVGKQIVVSVSNSMPDEDFASTRGEHITLNAKALRNRKITERNIIDGGLFSSTCAEDIIIHEYGHIISTFNGNRGLEISGNAYYNMHGKEATGSELLHFLEKNVSEYATTFKNGKYTEITPEVLAKNNSNPDEFTKEFIRLLKEASSNEES